MLEKSLIWAAKTSFFVKNSLKFHSNIQSEPMPSNFGLFCILVILETLINVLISKICEYISGSWGTEDVRCPICGLRTIWIISDEAQTAFEFEMLQHLVLSNIQFKET